MSIAGKPVVRGQWSAALSSALAVILLALAGHPLRAQPAMTTIVTNGPVSNRMNIVMLSEGYTTNQLGQFLADATNAANVLLGWEPYQEYRNYCNVFAIKVASNESGSDHPVAALYKDTYFNSSYDGFADYYITIPPNDVDSSYSHGQGRVDSLLQTFVPQCDLSILLLNDTTWGGSDGFDATAITYVGPNLYQVLPHETGHVLANLGDEYSYAYPGFPDVEEPNTTRETNRAAIKWNAWISTNTPVPTPPSSQNSADVGLFEGAHYHAAGWYRPKLDCAMKSFGVGFCEVCREALVKAVYERVRPIDGFTPAGTNITLNSTQSQAFSVTVLQPLSHNLNAQWLTNGVAVAGQTNITFTLQPNGLPDGSNHVSVLVHDGTAWVKNDPSNLLGQAATWSINIGAQLHLDSPLILANGAFVFRVSGTSAAAVIVEGSTNLVQWSPLATNALVGGKFWHTNSGTAAYGARFFRAVTQ